MTACCCRGRCRLVLAGLNREVLDAYGVPLATAISQLKATLPKSAILVGQNINKVRVGVQLSATPRLPHEQGAGQGALRITPPMNARTHACMAASARRPCERGACMQRHRMPRVLSLTCT